MTDIGQVVHHEISSPVLLFLGFEQIFPSLMTMTILFNSLKSTYPFRYKVGSGLAERRLF